MQQIGMYYIQATVSSVDMLHLRAVAAAKGPNLKPPARNSTTPIPEFLVNKTRFFLRARADRSGAAILDYLKGLSMALEFGLEFGGICGETLMVDTHKAMVQTLGLDTLIRFRSCPNNRTTDFIAGDRVEHNRGIAGSFSSPAVMHFIRAVSHARRGGQRPSDANNNRVGGDMNKGAARVGVHIRRGDVDPCGYFARYLPNSLYLKLIDLYSPAHGADVTIFSEEYSYEPWSDFSNFTLSLGGNLTDVWQSMLESDVLILSRSSFSIVPAIISSRIRTAVYLPYLRNDPKPLPEWTVVNNKALKEGMRRTEQLKAACSESDFKAALANSHAVPLPAIFTWPKDV